MNKVPITSPSMVQSYIATEARNTKDAKQFCESKTTKLEMEEKCRCSALYQWSSL